MQLTDKIYIVENQRDMFGDVVVIDETSIDCRVMARQLVTSNLGASSKEDRYELKLYIPYLKSEPYSSFGQKNYKLFRFEDVMYELVLKIIVKDFFGVQHHYELTVKEYDSA